MDWEQLREKTLAQVGTALVTEGAGTAGGFVGAAFIGRQVQNLLGQSDTGVSANPWVNGTLAWVTNNAPKALIWYFTRKYAIEPGEVVTPSKEVVSDARKALAGSIVFDTLMRLTNGGTNPASAKLYGWEMMGSGNGPTPEVQKSMQADVQRLIQENSALRAELNKALQRLATPPAPVQVQAPPVQVQAPPVPVVQAPPPVPVQVQAPPAPVVQAPPVQPAPVTQVRPAPAPVVQAQPITQPPVIRYQPVAPPAAPVVRPAPVAQPARPAPIVAREVTPYVQQPVPPAVSERERKYGFMHEAQTPPAVQEREKKFGFMRGGEEKEIAAMFGML